MKRNINLITFIGMIITLVISMHTGAAAQILISEIEIDPPSETSDACQYTEIRGTPGNVVPANTYFLSINSDGGNFGFLNQAVNIGGLTFGANGTITLVNTSFGACPNRTYGTGTTLFSYFQPLRVGRGSETYLIVQATGNLFSGLDIDTNDDGIFDANLGVTAVLDGFALLVNPEEEYVYGASAGVVNISNTTSLDQPDAVTRFANNNTPFAASAFFYGELAASPDETTEYVNPRSPNFPDGGRLTPGDGNLGGPAASGKTRGDFDGDGRTDLAVFRPSDSNWFLNRSSAGFVAIQWGLADDILVPGDYDGDNRTDTAIFRNGIWAILAGNYDTVQLINFGQAGDIPVPADYDNDNKTDVAVYRPGVGAWYVLNSSNGQFVSAFFGQAGDVPVVGDFDGDGKADFTVFRAGQWITQKSTGGVSYTTFGQAGDKLVPADYDGDNKDDIAVFRNGVWYILRSSNGAVDYISFGFETDVPVPGDYDGDGRDDQAVYRNGVWYLNRSTSGFATAVFGTGSDKAIPNEYLP